MISILHLLWIIPVTFSAGGVCMGMFRIGKRDEEIAAEIEREKIVELRWGR